VQISFNTGFKLLHVNCRLV